MTIALQRENSDTVFFDAVLSFTENYQSRLTAHPIDGANIKDGINVANDHVVTENPVFTIRGVFSSVDFNTARPRDSKYKILNDNSVPSPVSVVKVQDTLLESIASNLLSFGNNVAPEVELSDIQTNTLDRVKEFLINARNNRESLTLVEFTAGGEIGSPVRNLVITSLQFNEDVDSGDGLNVDIALQKANFVKLVTTKVHPRSVAAEMKDKAAPKVYKGPLSRAPNVYVFEDDYTKLTTPDAARSFPNLPDSSSTVARDLINHLKGSPDFKEIARLLK